MCVSLRGAHICTTDQVAGDTRNEFQVWSGNSQVSGGPISRTPDRQFTVAGFLYSRRCWSWSKTSLSYNAGFLPAAIVNVPNNFTIPGGGNGTVVVVLHGPLVFAHSVYGVAVTPVGFTFDAWRSRRVYPFIEADGGIIKSVEPVPYTEYPSATTANFLMSLGSGVKVRLGKSIAASLGYKLMHLSNGHRTSFNPGLDNNVVFAGISLLK
jgi:hypothetical protein